MEIFFKGLTKFSYFFYFFKERPAQNISIISILDPSIPDQNPPITNLILYGSSNQNIKEIQNINTIADRINTKMTSCLKVI